MVGDQRHAQRFGRIRAFRPPDRHRRGRLRPDVVRRGHGLAGPHGGVYVRLLAPLQGRAGPRDLLLDRGTPEPRGALPPAHALGPRAVPGADDPPQDDFQQDLQADGASHAALHGHFRVPRPDHRVHGAYRVPLPGPDRGRQLAHDVGDLSGHLPLLSVPFAGGRRLRLLPGHALPEGVRIYLDHRRLHSRTVHLPPDHHLLFAERLPEPPDVPRVQVGQDDPQGIQPARRRRGGRGSAGTPPPAGRNHNNHT